MSQIEPLDQPPFDPLILPIIKNFSVEYSKYKKKEADSAIIKYFQDRGITNHGIWNMVNKDIVIASKSGSSNNINGPAVVLYKDQTVFVGSLANTQRSGFGYRTFKDPSLVYVGEYSHDVKNGEGRLYSLKGNKWVFKGLYANDVRNGHGHLEKLDGCVYYGNYVNDRMNGHGIMHWGNGSQYEGNFKDDLKHGQGKMTWGNQDTYEGEFLNNTISGKGVYMWKNGEKYDGQFEKGNLSGQGVMDYTSVIPIKGSGFDVNSIRHLNFNVLHPDELNHIH